MKNKIVKAALVVLVLSIALAILFGIVYGFTWLVCWCFSLEFSWKVALGVFTIAFIVDVLDYARHN